MSQNATGLLQDTENTQWVSFKVEVADLGHLGSLFEAVFGRCLGLSQAVILGCRQGRWGGEGGGGGGVICFSYLGLLLEVGVVLGWFLVV